MKSMIKFKHTMTEKINQFKYYILTLVTITLLSAIGFYDYYKTKYPEPIGDETAFNVSIDGRNYIMPSPFHSLHFLNSMGFSWKGLAEYNSNTDYSNESQVALNMGTRTANAIVLLYANDNENAVRARKVAVILADKLNITPDIKDAVSELHNAVIANKDQFFLNEKILQVQHKMEQALHNKKKENLAVLVELGGWLEAVHLISKGIANNYNPGHAEILRQPHITEIYIDVVTALSHRSTDIQEKKLLDSILEELNKIYKITNHTHKEAFPLEKVKELHTVSLAIKKIIESNK